MRFHDARLSCRVTHHSPGGGILQRRTPPLWFAPARFSYSERHFDNDWSKVFISMVKREIETQRCIYGTRHHSLFIGVMPALSLNTIQAWWISFFSACQVHWSVGPSLCLPAPLPWQLIFLSRYLFIPLKALVAYGESVVAKCILQFPLGLKRSL